MARQGKKGFIAINQLVRWILIILAFTLVIVFVIKLLTSLAPGTIEQSCRASIVMRANLHKELKLAPDVKNVYPIQCETQDLTVPTTEISSRMENEEIKDLVYDDIGDLMAKCWFMFGNGRFYDLFDDSWQNSKMCHVCYSFIISRGATPFVEEQSVDELMLYLYTHPYSPGILLSGDAVAGESGQLSFTAQDIRESSLETRQLTESRLLSSQKRLQLGVADFTGLFSKAEYQDELAQLRSSLTNIARGNGASGEQEALVPVVIIVPSLPEMVWEGNSNIAYQVLKDWGVGSQETFNGMVFVLSLNDGKMAYATDTGASAVFPSNIIESNFLEASSYFNQNQALEGTVAFVEGLVAHIEEITQDRDVNAIVNFQRTYGAYISGGILSAEDYGQGHNADSLRSIISRGAITYEDELNLATGEIYDVVFISNKQYDQSGWNWALGLGFLDDRQKKLSNMIGIAKHNDLINPNSNEHLCNIYEG